MIPELLVLLVGALGASGAGRMWWLYRAQRRYVASVQTEWVRAGQIVHYGPVAASCLGQRPSAVYSRDVFGALGITDGRLVFSGRRSSRFDASIPLASIHRIGLTTLPVQAGTLSTRKRALAVHYDSPDGWRVGVFVTKEPPEIAQALANESGLPVHDSGGERDDCGPAHATRMLEDVYGDWTPDRDGVLYLAPDRLLFNWRDPILLDDIRRLDVVTKRSVNPLAPDLLRVEHETADGEPHVTGFVVRRARRWAEAILRRTDVPLDVHLGRKAKNS
ncbi:MAG TPA: hypothetical protein VMT24_09445 [Aggregatilineaceae bacterium]|nr:hypothetical protein [Aggregatilineaceae bacterium]